MRLETAEDISAINAAEFINTVQPSLIQGKVEEAILHVKQRWTPLQVVELLRQ